MLLLMPLLSAMANVDQTLEFRPQTPEMCERVPLRPAEVSSLTTLAQRHFRKHASARFRDRRLELIRACRLPNDKGAMRIAFSILVVSDTEAVYEIRRGKVRDAYLITYWN